MGDSLSTACHAAAAYAREWGLMLVYRYAGDVVKVALCTMYLELMACHTIFFFQAEDGIRDLTVTGVQTCALPILTEKMVTALVYELGTKSDDDRKSFPTAEVMAEQSVAFYRDKIRSGYRAPYLKELADRVASGELNVESWLTNDAPLADLMKEMKSVKGVGNYAAENLLKLIGRYDGLALDSWTRAQFARIRNSGRAANDKKIGRYYARFNTWRGLALWCDMTRHWLDPENVAKW